jgi:hypothetical protein
MSLEMLKEKNVATVNASDNEPLLQEVLTLLSEQLNHVDDSNLTRLCMQASEKSLSEAWDKEDDERWNAFLKD